MEQQNNTITVTMRVENGNVVTSPNIKTIDFKEAMDEIPDMGSKVAITKSSTPVHTSVGALSQGEMSSIATPVSQNKPVTIKISIPKGMSIEEFLVGRSGKKSTFLTQDTVANKTSKPEATEKKKTINVTMSSKPIIPSVASLSQNNSVSQSEPALQIKPVPALSLLGKHAALPTDILDGFESRYRVVAQQRPNAITMQPKLNFTPKMVEHIYYRRPKRPRMHTISAQETLTGETINVELVTDGTKPSDTPKNTDNRQDVSHEDIFLYLTTKNFQKNTPRSRRSVIITASKRFSLKDDQLYYKKRNTLYVKPPYDQYLREAHDMSGHQMTRLTQSRIQSKYYWPSIRKDVYKWIENCKHCQQHKKEDCAMVAIASGYTPEGKNCDRCRKGRGRKMPSDKQTEMEMYADLLAMDGDVPLDAFNTPGEPMNLSYGRHQQTAAMNNNFQNDYIVDKYENMDAEQEKEADESLSQQPKDKQVDVRDQMPITYEEIRRYLETKSYAEGTPQNRKRSIVTSVNRFRLEDGEVFHIQNNIPYVSGPKEMFLKECHEIGGHMEARESMDALKQRYYWPAMYTDMKQWINECERCSKLRNLKHYLDKRKSESTTQVISRYITPVCRRSKKTDQCWKDSLQRACVCR